MISFREFAILTNIIHQEWADITVKQYKDLKDLKKQNLRNHMSEAKLWLHVEPDKDPKNTVKRTWNQSRVCVREADF